jgi:hypothetical protein
MTHHLLHPPLSPPASSSLVPSPSHLSFQSPPDPALRSRHPLKKRKKRKEEEKCQRKKEEEEEKDGRKKKKVCGASVRQRDAEIVLFASENTINK